MKITLRKLRALLRETLLLEEKCPLCGTDGAYIGLNDVECPNPNCDRFTPSLAPTKKKGIKGTLRFGVWSDHDPRSIDFASLQVLSIEAADAMEANVSAEGEELDDVPIWVATDPTQTNEEELQDWMAAEWDNLAVDHGGKKYVLFYGTEDDEYGNMWDASLGEWQSYMF